MPSWDLQTNHATLDGMLCMLVDGNCDLETVPGCSLKLYKHPSLTLTHIHVCQPQAQSHHLQFVKNGRHRCKV